MRVQDLVFGPGRKVKCIMLHYVLDEIYDDVVGGSEQVGNDTVKEGEELYDDVAGAASVVIDQELYDDVAGTGSEV